MPSGKLCISMLPGFDDGKICRKGYCRHAFWKTYGEERSIGRRAGTPAPLAGEGRSWRSDSGGRGKGPATGFFSGSFRGGPCLLSAFLPAGAALVLGSVPAWQQLLQRTPCLKAQRRIGCFHAGAKFTG